MEDKIWTCIVKRLSCTETEESAAVLDKWLRSDAAHIRQYQEAEALWKMTGSIEPELPAQEASSLIREYRPGDPRKHPGRMSFWKYGIAAALTGAMILAGVHLLRQDKPQSAQWVVHKTMAGTIDTLTLPDKSTVLLNAGTEIRYRSDFNNSKLRDIQLKGEAYFDVQHDSKHPFVVTSGELKTTVYGTSFNIRAYPDETEMSVAVNSGKVGVQKTSSPDSAIFLLPNDKLSFRKGELIRSKLSTADVSSWRNGVMIFEQTPLNDVLATISRKYDVMIDTGTGNYEDCKLTARFKDQPLSSILKTLNISMNISSSQVKDTIYLKGGNCM